MIYTWNCDICGKERPDTKISVYVHDRSLDKNLPEGKLHENVKYCNDNYDCMKSAETFSFLRERKKEEKSVNKEKKEMSDLMKYVYTFIIFFSILMVFIPFLATLIQGNVTFMEKLFYVPGIFMRICLAAYFSFKYAKNIFKN